MATEKPLKWRRSGAPRLRTANLLPNFFTSCNVACGIAAILHASDGRYEMAGWLILAGCFFDVLDGRVAKLLRTSSSFGVQLDSLADAISFGVAPAILFRGLLYKPDSRYGFSMAILYVLCTALRLARYNVGALKSSGTNRKTFVGLPCPCAAALLASLAVVLHEYNFVAAEQPVQLAIHLLTLGLSVLMVSRVAYPDLIATYIERRSVFNHMVAVAVILSFSVIDPPMVILAGSTAFTIGGPFLSVFYYRNDIEESDSGPGTGDEMGTNVVPIDSDERERNV